MSKRILEIIQNAEKKAVEIKKQSIQDANSILAQAQTQGLEIINEAEKKGAEMKKQMIAQANIKAEIQGNESSLEIEKKAQTFSNNSRANMDEAVNLIVRSVIQ